MVPDNTYQTQVTCPATLHVTYARIYIGDHYFDLALMKCVFALFFKQSSHVTIKVLLSDHLFECVSFLLQLLH